MPSVVLFLTRVEFVGRMGNNYPLVVQAILLLGLSDFIEMVISVLRLQRLPSVLFLKTAVKGKVQRSSFVSVLFYKLLNKTGIINHFALCYF